MFKTIISFLIRPKKLVVKFHASVHLSNQGIHVLNSTGRHSRTILSSGYLDVNYCSAHNHGKLTPDLCLQLPSADCHVTLKRVSILFNFTKIQFEFS